MLWDFLQATGRCQNSYYVTVLTLTFFIFSQDQGRVWKQLASFLSSYFTIFFITSYHHILFYYLLVEVLRELSDIFSIAEECRGFTLQVFTGQSQYPDGSGPVGNNPSPPLRVLCLSFHFLHRWPQSDL